MSEQQPEAASDIQDTASRFLTTLQPYAPAILSGLEFITKATQAFSDFFAREIAPHMETLARIDWAEVTRRLNELPAKSKAAMVLASSKGWFFGWDQSLEDVLVLVEKMAQIDPSEVDELLSQYYRDTIGRGLASGELYEGLWENVGTPAQLQALDQQLKAR